MKKDSSSKGVIPADQLGQWRSWTMGELAPQSTGLTVAQMEALSAVAGEAASDGTVTEPVEREEEPIGQQLGYPTAAELETIHQEAWQAGHDAGLVAGQEEGREQGLAEGRAEGLEAARAQFASAWAPLESMALRFSHELQALEAGLARDVLTLSVRLAERLVAAHLAVDTHAIEPLLQEVLSALPTTVAQGRLRVNPQDLEVARAFLQLERPETVWQWIEDAEVPRGGCLLETASLKQDLTQSARMRAIYAALGLDEDEDESV